MNGPEASYRISALTLFAFALCSVSYAEFRPMYHVVTEIDRPAALSVADLNNDGNIDVLVASDANNLVGWCANYGDGQFGSLEIIAGDLDGVNAICTGDLDNDGDLDVISLAVRPSRYRDPPHSMITWYTNDGLGQFYASQSISTETCEIQSVHTEDLDKDGDLDILFSAFIPALFSDPRSDPNSVDENVPTTMIGWYANDGAGRFALQQTVTLEVAGIQSVYLTDMDADDNVDILAVIDGYQIAWFRNNGKGHFETHQVIHTSTARVSRVCTADLNGDGHPDILAAFDGKWSDPSIAWYENDGSGGFGPIQEIPVGIEMMYRVNAVRAIDVDNDGDLDVAVIHYACAHICSYAMAWYANDGSGQFSFRQEIGDVEYYGSLSTFSVADMDNDGDLDIVGMNRHENEVRWFENGGLGYGPQLTISKEMERPNGVSAADLDNDGDLDVLATGYTDYRHGTMSWYENKGSRQFGPQQLIQEGLPTYIELWSICLADLDSDGDVDIVSSFRDSNDCAAIRWHQNDGSGAFSLQPVSSPEDYTATSVLAVDLDGDEDLDVLGAGYFIFWYANNGSGQFGPMQMIDRGETYSRGGIKNLLAVDMDGDGDMDVVSTLNWYENDGTGQFGSRQVISTDTDGLDCVHAADLDGDGDMDILSTASQYYTGGNSVRYIGWYENDGSGQFGPMQLISSDVWEVRSIYAADIDGDGDLDVLMVAYYEDKVAWFKNDGTGKFGEQHVIYDRADGASCVYAADMDGDGDMDVLSASSEDNTIALYDNE